MSLISSFGLSTKPSLSQFHSLLKCYTESKNPRRVLLVFRELLVYDEKPNDLTFALLLKGCSSTTNTCTTSSSSCRLSSFEVNLVHTQLIKSGCYRFVHLSTALLDLYAKSGCFKFAQHVFDDMPHRDVVSWNALICGLSRNGCHFDSLYLFVRMLREGFSPCQTTFSGLIPACGNKGLVLQAKTIHGFGIKTGLDLDSQVKNALTSVYAKNKDLESTELLFEEIFDKTVVTWNTMISAFGQNGCYDEALLVFKQMREQKIEANPVTMVCLISANADPESTHCFAVKTGLIGDFSVSTSFVCGYAKHGSSKSAEALYSSLHHESLVALTAIMSCHAEKGNMQSVIEHFTQIQHLELKPDAVTMLGIVHGISEPAHFSLGLAFHSYGIKVGLSTDTLFANGLISMYSKFDHIEDTLSIFYEMREKPLISWNSLISGCVQSGRPRFAFTLFSEMKVCGYKPDAITITSLLSSCGQLGYLRIGENIHNYILINNIEVESFIETALIDMYTKCGRVEHAENVFKTVNDPCLATWNSMISGYSLYGQERKALSSFSEMQKRGQNPDQVTFLGVLSACNHGGLVLEGREIFDSMTKNFNIAPSLQHYTCMVGLLGQAGLFGEALVLIKDMALKPDIAVWSALLNACCVHKEVRLGEYLAKKLFLLDNANGGFYVLMSNLYAFEGRWDDVAKVREMMREIDSFCYGVSVVEVTSLGEIN